MVGRCRRGALDNDWTSRLQGQICLKSGFFDAVSIWPRPGASGRPAVQPVRGASARLSYAWQPGPGTANRRMFLAPAACLDFDRTFG